MALAQLCATNRAASSVSAALTSHRLKRRLIRFQFRIEVVGDDAPVEPEVGIATLPYVMWAASTPVFVQSSGRISTGFAKFPRGWRNCGWPIPDSRRNRDRSTGFVEHIRKVIDFGIGAPSLNSGTAIFTAFIPTVVPVSICWREERRFYQCSLRADANSRRVILFRIIKMNRTRWAVRDNPEAAGYFLRELMARIAASCIVVGLGKDHTAVC
jgi:hypothetical protein